MKNTNTKAFRATVWEYLANSLYDFDGDFDSRVARLYEKFADEYDHPANRAYHGHNIQAMVSGWLSGLPLNIAYSYCDIIEVSESWHECKLTEAQADMICERWFDFLAFKLIQLWRKNGVDI